MKQQLSPAVTVIIIVCVVLLVAVGYWWFGGGRQAAGLPGPGAPAKQPPPLPHPVSPGKR